MYLYSDEELFLRYSREAREIAERESRERTQSTCRHQYRSINWHNSNGGYRKCVVCGQGDFFTEESLERERRTCNHVWITDSGIDCCKYCGKWRPGYKLGDNLKT